MCQQALRRSRIVWAVVAFVLMTSGAFAQSSPTADGQAVATLLDRAVSGDRVAQFDLGWRYHEGNGVAQDYAAAVEWIRKAADQDYPLALVRFGNLYEWGHGVAEDYSAAALWYRRAADRGLPQGAFALGLLYKRGDGVPKNSAEAAAWFRRGAEGGFPVAAFALAQMYREGDGVATDPVNAFAWLLVASVPGGPPYIDGARIEMEKTLSAEQMAAAQHLASALRAGVQPAAALPGVR